MTPVQHRHEIGPEDAVAEILARPGTAAERVAALERSESAEFAYGQRPQSDEEVEVTVVASFLQATKRNWRRELESRAAGNAPRRQGWEAFQQEMDGVTQGVERTEEVWFLQDNGYMVSGRNRAELDAIAAARENPPLDDPQQLLGLTYQRDTLYSVRTDSAISRHVGAFDASTPAHTAAAWVDDVVRVHADGDELRLRINSVDGDAAGVTIRGSVLEGPVGNRGLSVGSEVQISTTASTGALTIQDQLMSGTWTGTFETHAYHQGRTRVNEGVGMDVPGAGAPEKRNRGPSLAVDDKLFDSIRDTYRNEHAPEQGYGRTLGPTRNRLNFEAAGWDVVVPPYRRLGGDAMFNEAAHPEPEPYKPDLPTPASVDVNDPNWYYNLTNSMPDRFVGGRSSSSAMYMTAATMLMEEDRLSQDEAKDLMAFAISDMVVSGEHSLPECMTSVVMAAGSSQPWQQTPLNLKQETPSLTAWMHLVDPAVRQQMETDARETLHQLVASPAPDPNLVKRMTMVLKTTTAFEKAQANSGLAETVRVGLNPTPASAQRVMGNAQQDARPRTPFSERDTGRDR
ncbi:hypothetical protein ACQHIV_37920 [Kribbella sp. GL6]|uniref:hypothetical protein n=1 Tax=Kribbella sp. GL6 TaxID=3419765 RepID=UPI003CFBD788